MVRGLGAEAADELRFDASSFGSPSAPPPQAPHGGASSQSASASAAAVRRAVLPTAAERAGREVVKVVYVVLEAQYQSCMTAAVRRINAGGSGLCVECVGYLLEEVRDASSAASLSQDLEDADIFLCSLIFVQDLAERLVDIVRPLRDSGRLAACLCFPSVPEVMKLNKLGSFDLAAITGGPLGSFAQQVKDIRQRTLGGGGGTGGSFQDGLLKLVRTLPKVLKFLPGTQARDARTFILSLQHWLGGTPENLQAMLLRIAGQYVPSARGKSLVDLESLMEPVVLPDMGIWHPCAPDIFDDTKEYNEWYEKGHLSALSSCTGAPVIGVVCLKSHISTRDDGHYVAFVQELERRGARVICVYTGGLDFSVPIREYLLDPASGAAAVDILVSLTGFSLVGGPARQDAAAAAATLKRLNVPYLVSVPLVFQSFTEWQQSDLGLHPVQVALQVALPELEGAIEPVIFAGRDRQSGRTFPMQDRISLLAARALGWANLRKKPNAEKRLCICLFQFPPDKGNVGTAAYLDVFGSIFAVLQRLHEEGYDIGGELPESVEALQSAVLNDSEASMSMADLSVAYRMSVDEYEMLCPYAEDLTQEWGPPPGRLNTDGKDLLIFGKRFGNVFLGVQPTFGYEGDPMRLLFAKSASPHHGFAAFYTYLDHVFKADCILHFGTHGSLEFMPGKQVGMSSSCYPDRLVSAVPNLYYYAANNPSEATIAKRRSYATTISYLTPPAENAGLYKGLQELGGLVRSYQQLRADATRGATIVDAIVATARQCSLDKDVPCLPGEDFDAKQVSLAQRDAIVGAVYRCLMEVESRTFAMGLHRIGVPPTAAESVATLVSIAQLDRPELGVGALPRVLAASRNAALEEVYRGADRGRLEDVTLLEQITAASRAAVRAFVKESTGADGRVVSPAERRRSGGGGGSGGSSTTEAIAEGVMIAIAGGRRSSGPPWRRALEESGFPGCNEAELRPLFDYLSSCLELLVRNDELASLVRALCGEFVEPGPGGDPVRNPGVLPTGKNMHALDPDSIPTKAAVDTALVVVDRLLEQLARNGEAPESIAFTLWGTDNIKTYGESLAQVLALVGARPTPDRLGRVNRVELIPLEELGRPRIDVVCSCSGVFRDIFVGQMQLLDKAFKMAAEADEPVEQNFLRKHALEQSKELGISLREASARVFTNAAGSYSANVGLAVENGSAVDEAQLQRQFVARKGFALSSDSPGKLVEAPELFEAVLRRVDVTFQNLDSSEISLTDVSHYFDSDPTKVVAGLRGDGSAPAAYIADTTTANAQVRTLSAQIRLDSRTKLLNPKFYEAALACGYEGVREVSKRLRYTFGWSTTADAVDNFVYEDANSTFIADESLRARLLKQNPDALRDMASTFLEAASKGYWATSEENLERLRQVYQDCENRLEGVDFVGASPP